MQTPRNATALLLEIENRLGWDPYEVALAKGEPVFKVRATEAGKLNAAMKRKPKGKQPPVTLANLALAVEYAQRHRLEVKAPYGVVYLIEKAIEERDADAPATGVDGDFESNWIAAIEYEEFNADDRSAYWMGRFMRAVGPARKDVLNEYYAERGYPANHDPS